MHAAIADKTQLAAFVPVEHQIFAEQADFANRILI
jgi:hypothetical protein